MAHWHELECYAHLREVRDSPGEKSWDVLMCIIGMQEEILSRKEQAYRMQLALNQFCEDMGETKPLQFVDVSHAHESFLKQLPSSEVGHKDSNESSLYFMRAGSTVKIGKAIDPQKRLAALQIGSSETLELIAVIPEAGYMETVIHHRLRHICIRGEWFHWTTEVEAVIADLRQQPKRRRRR